jgi:hypothetical protein
MPVLFNCCVTLNVTFCLRIRVILVILNVWLMIFVDSPAQICHVYSCVLVMITLIHACSSFNCPEHGARYTTAKLCEFDKFDERPGACYDAYSPNAANAPWRLEPRGVE